MIYDFRFLSAFIWIVRIRAELPNLRKCKLSHTGVEYRGNVFVTKSKYLCRSWNSMGMELDEKFMDGSKRLAKNYCRNPNGTRPDLWCYTFNKDSPVESCAVYLCNSKKCKMTGPGVEYGGHINTTKTGHSCVRWAEVPNDLSASSAFPERSFTAAGNRCRNPNGDSGGPWCYAKVDGTVVKDYCDAVDCDLSGCATYVSGYGHSSGAAHGHYSTAGLKGAKDGYLRFVLKAWDPTDRSSRTVRLALVEYPSIAEKAMQGTGFEVVVPATAFTAASPVYMDLSWNNGFVVLTATAGGHTKEVFSQELDATTLPLLPISYLSISGVAAVVGYPHCITGCEEHVTNNQGNYRIWPLRRTEFFGTELIFSIRAVLSASITYYTAPSKQAPRLNITLQARPLGQIIISYLETTTGEEQEVYRQSFDAERIFSYWTWHQYFITILDKKLEVQKLNKHNKTIALLSITDFKFQYFHWFSIGSETVAHWTLYCSGPENYPLPVAELPECTITEMANEYRGSKWITEDGQQCLPWNITSVRKKLKENQLVDGSYVAAKNYCRNPTNDPQGPYCYVATAGTIVLKRHCRIRKCRNTECHVAGVATDYVGTLNKTISNRTCLKWTKRTNSKYFFSDKSIKDASNYCRNPTREPTGVWCYTGDNAETDLCDVPSCTVDDSEALLVGGKAGRNVHWLYVMPEWRITGMRVRLKYWIPTVYEGIALYFKSFDETAGYDVLDLGAEKNQKLKLYKTDGSGDRSRVKEQVFPHLLLAGKWREFRFNMDASGSVEMRSEDDQATIMQWSSEHHLPSKNKRIVFVGVSTIDEGYVGVRFVSGDCLTHVSTSEEFSVYLPINFHSDVSLGKAENKINFHLRHEGTTRIALIQQRLDRRYELEIQSNRVTFSWWSKDMSPKVFEIHEFESDVIKQNSWSDIDLKWTESTLSFKCHAGLRIWTLPADSTPLLVRYFSIGNRNGRTTWTVNCDPPDIDGRPRDGGWSEWSEWQYCTKTCGTGTGTRTRQCNQPKPNMFGKPCTGPSTSKGQCNVHECGQLSEKVIKTVHDKLRNQTHNVRANEGDTLSLSCDKNIVEIVKRDLVNPEFKWLKNGRLLVVDNKMVVNSERCKLVIPKCSYKNAGVYAFTVQPPESQIVVLKLFAVAIKQKPTSVYLGDKIQVQCNAATLGYLFDGLSQQWMLNDSFLIKDYGITTLAVDVDTITVEKLNFQGIWTCVVRRAATNSSWTTEIRDIRRPSNAWTRLMQDPLIKMIFWKVNSPIIMVRICVVLIMSVCLCTWGGTCVFNRWRKQLTKKNNKR